MLDLKAIEREVWIDLTPDDSGDIDSGIYVFDNRLTPTQARLVARRLLHHALTIEHYENRLVTA